MTTITEMIATKEYAKEQVSAWAIKDTKEKEVIFHIRKYHYPKNTHRL